MRAPTRKLLLLLAFVPVLVTGCVDVGTVRSKSEGPLQADGSRMYIVETRNPNATHQRLTTPDDPWVRECFEQAVQGESTPYYCATDRTVTGTWIGGVTAAASLGVTWLLSAAVALRLPAAAPLGPPGSGVWIFERTAAEKRAYHPVARALSRMAVSRFGFRAGVAATVAAFAVAYVAGVAGPRWIAEWAGAAGAFHVVLYSVSYFAWILRGTLSDEVRQTRLAIGIGVGIGLFLASMVLEPGG